MTTAESWTAVRETTVEITLIEMTQNIKKLPSCELRLKPSFVFHSYLLSLTTSGWMLGTRAFTPAYTGWRLNIIFSLLFIFFSFTIFWSFEPPISSFSSQQPPFSSLPRSDTRLLVWRWLHVSVHMLADPHWTPILGYACGSCICLLVYVCSMCEGVCMDMRKLEWMDTHRWAWDTGEKVRLTHTECNLISFSDCLRLLVYSISDELLYDSSQWDWGQDEETIWAEEEEREWETQWATAIKTRLQYYLLSSPLDFF